MHHCLITPYLGNHSSDATSNDANLLVKLSALACSRWPRLSRFLARFPFRPSDLPESDTAAVNGARMFKRSLWH